MIIATNASYSIMKVIHSLSQKKLSAEASTREQELGDQTTLFMVCFSQDLRENRGALLGKPWVLKNLLTPGITHRKFSREPLAPTGLCMIAIHDSSSRLYAA